MPDHLQMQLIRCTQKLLRELGNPAEDLFEDEPRFRYLGTWYANLLRIDRRKCLLFTNENTLYPFVVAPVVKADLKDFGELFRETLWANLKFEEFPLEAIAKAVQEYEEIGIAKTKSKSVLGSMVDFAYQVEYRIMDNGGVLHSDMRHVSGELNRAPMGRSSIAIR